ncbi:MAG TPA: thioesterase family protein [Marmoricola sp.]|nr:thioesterase family protein [Marmoricola sp.]
MTPGHGRGTSELDRLLTLSAAEGGSYRAEIEDGWAIGPAVNGGVLLAMVGKALATTFEGRSHPHPLAVSGYFLSAGRSGPATLSTQVIREGRSMATGQASLVQEGPDGEPVERLRVLATYGDLSRLTGEVCTTAEPPALPDPGDCLSASAGGPGPAAAFIKRFDMRLDPATAGWALGEPSRRGVIQGWLRMADDREPDPIMLLLAVDAFPPVTFDMGIAGWAPTLELSAHVRAVPAPGWLRVRVSTRNLAGGLLEEDAEVWDSQDRLVAQARQLARVPTQQR